MSINMGTARTQGSTVMAAEYVSARGAGQQNTQPDRAGAEFKSQAAKEKASHVTSTIDVAALMSKNYCLSTIEGVYAHKAYMKVENPTGDLLQRKKLWLLLSVSLLPGLVCAWSHHSDVTATFKGDEIDCHRIARAKTNQGLSETCPNPFGKTDP